MLGERESFLEVSELFDVFELFLDDLTQVEEEALSLRFHIDLKRLKLQGFNVHLHVGRPQQLDSLERAEAVGVIVLVFGYWLYRYCYFLCQQAGLRALRDFRRNLPRFRDSFTQLARIPYLHVQAHPLSIAALPSDLQVHLVQPAHSVRELYGQTELCRISFCQLDASDLHRAQLLEKPLMVVPRALVLRICEVGVLQLLKVGLDRLERDGVCSVVVAQAVAAVEARHELATVVPGREIGEVLLDQGQSHLALCLDEHLLVLFIYFFRSFPLQLSPLGMLLQESLYHPQFVIPAMKVPFILFQHFVAQQQLILQDVRVHLDLWQLLLELEALLQRPLPLKPERVALWTLHDALHEELELGRDHLHLSWKLFLVEEVEHDLSSVVPECGEIWRQERELLGLHQRLLCILFILPFLKQDLVVSADFLQFLLDFFKFFLANLLRLIDLFPTVKHFEILRKYMNK